MVSKNESYEAMLGKLDKIVASMEKEELTLEGTMKNYEEGIKLCNKLYKYLNDAEGKIKILSGGEEKDFLEAKE